MYPPNAEQPPPGCPAHQNVSLYTPEFAADPQAFYEAMRARGPATPVEIAPGVEAYLVTSYAAARWVLTQPEMFSKDANRWVALQQGMVPADSPVLGMMAPRSNCMFSDGQEHLRLRQAVTDSLSRVDSHVLERTVGQVAEYLIGGFATRGEADLLRDYAKAVPLLVFNQLFGCPPETGDQIMYGMSAIFDGHDVENANQQLGQGLLALVTHKRRNPGEDVTSWLVQHPAGLSDTEMCDQLLLLMGAGTEPARNLIANALMMLLGGDDNFAGGGYGGGLLVEEAINAVLWNQTPIANYAVHYAKQTVDMGGVKIPAGVPILISFAAANTDPAVASARATTSARAHLAWGAGPHACPAKDQATLIARTAIERLMNRLFDIELDPTVQLSWRPGPFHRALHALPARFTAERPPVAALPTEAQRPVPPQQQQPQEPVQSKTIVSSFLRWLRGGA